MFGISKQRLQKDIEFLKDYLPSYFKNPIHEIKTAPVINLEIMMLTLVSLNLVFGLLRSFYSLSFLGFLAHIIITPLFGCVALLLISLFTFYVLQFLLQKDFPFEQIMSIYFFAYLPGSLFFIASIYYPPLFILGLLLSSSLLTIGLTDNLKLQRKFVLRTVIVAFILCLIFWAFDFFYIHQNQIQPKSLDDLESEMDLTQ